jgi:hypothetical protein
MILEITNSTAKSLYAEEPVALERGGDGIYVVSESPTIIVVLGAPVPPHTTCCVDVTAVGIATVRSSALKRPYDKAFHNDMAYGVHIDTSTVNMHGDAVMSLQKQRVKFDELIAKAKLIMSAVDTSRDDPAAVRSLLGQAAKLDGRTDSILNASQTDASTFYDVHDFMTAGERSHDFARSEADFVSHITNARASAVSASTLRAGIGDDLDTRLNKLEIQRYYNRSINDLKRAQDVTTMGGLDELLTSATDKYTHLADLQRPNNAKTKVVGVRIKKITAARDKLVGVKKAVDDFDFEAGDYDALADEVKEIKDDEIVKSTGTSELKNIAGTVRKHIRPLLRFYTALRGAIKAINGAKRESGTNQDALIVEAKEFLETAKANNPTDNKKRHDRLTEMMNDIENTGGSFASVVEYSYADAIAHKDIVGKLREPGRPLVVINTPANFTGIEVKPTVDGYRKFMGNFRTGDAIFACSDGGVLKFFSPGTLIDWNTWTRDDPDEAAIFANQSDYHDTQDYMVAFVDGVPYTNGQLDQNAIAYASHTQKPGANLDEIARLGEFDSKQVVPSKWGENDPMVGTDKTYNPNYMYALRLATISNIADDDIRRKIATKGRPLVVSTFKPNGFRYDPADAWGRGAEAVWGAKYLYLDGDTLYSSNTAW